MFFKREPSDVSHDGTVDLTDLISIDNDASAFVGGYVNTDLNGDGSVDLSDLILVDNNASAFVGKIVPPGSSFLPTSKQMLNIDEKSIMIGK